MLARAVHGPKGLALGGHDLALDAGLGERRLHGLGDLHEGGRVQRIDADVEAVRVAGLGEQLLALGDVERIGRLLERAPQPGGPERLVGHELAGEEGVLHALVVDQVADRLHDVGLAEDRV